MNRSLGVFSQFPRCLSFCPKSQKKYLVRIQFFYSLVAVYVFYKDFAINLIKGVTRAHHDHTTMFELAENMVILERKGILVFLVKNFKKAILLWFHNRWSGCLGFWVFFCLLKVFLRSNNTYALEPGCATQGNQVMYEEQGRLASSQHPGSGRYLQSFWIAPALHLQSRLAEMQLRDIILFWSETRIGFPQKQKMRFPKSVLFNQVWLVNTIFQLDPINTGTRGLPGLPKIG